MRPPTALFVCVDSARGASRSSMPFRLVAFVAATLSLNAISATPTNDSLPDQLTSIIWAQQQKVSGSDAGAQDYISVVLINGQYAFLGDPSATIGSNSHQGAVYAFAKSGTTWVQTQKITASDGAAFDEFGNAISFDPTGGLVVGASNKQIGTHTQQGAAYTFAPVMGTWIQSQELFASDGVQADMFGFSVAISDTAIFISAPEKTKGSAQAAGAVYVFQKSSGSWVQKQELSPETTFTEYFGWSLAINGNTTFIGSPYYNDGTSDVGAVYAFTKQTCPGGVSCWTKQQVIFPPLTTPTDSIFGFSIATSGTTLMVGAPAAGYNYATRWEGLVDVYELSSGVWTSTQQLVSSDIAVDDSFGHGLALSGSVALIGAPRNLSPGAVYSFEKSGSTWVQQQEFEASDGISADHFGTEISISSTTALVGADGATVGTHADQGAGYFFSH